MSSVHAQDLPVGFCWHATVMILIGVIPMRLNDGTQDGIRYILEKQSKIVSWGLSIVPLVLCVVGNGSSVLGPTWGVALYDVFFSSLFSAYYIRLSMRFSDTRLKSSTWQGFLFIALDMALFLFLNIASRVMHRLYASFSLDPRFGVVAISTLSVAFVLPQRTEWRKLSISRAILLLVIILSILDLGSRAFLEITNLRLSKHGFAVLARRHSSTGYISVLENFHERYRVLRCDHSLLGGQWHSMSSGTEIVHEPTFAVFVMLEAVRLVTRRSPEDYMIKKTPELESESVSSAHQSPPAKQESALFIGLGIGTSAAALMHHGVQTTIIELDPVVHEFALKYFDLPPYHTIIMQDALHAIKNLAKDGNTSRKFDYIIHDVFTGGLEPLPLFTASFLQELKSALKDDGIIAINYGGDLARASTTAVIKTILSVFRTCRAFRDTAPNPSVESARIMNRARGKKMEDTVEDMANMVMFCQVEANLPITFRQPLESDYLNSDARREHLIPLPEYEIDLNSDRFRLDSHVGWSSSNISGTMHNEIDSKMNIAQRDQIDQRDQRESARAHWHLMRKLIPHAVWETW